MKVLHTICLFPGDYGSEIFIDQLSQEMIKKDHQIVVITSDLVEWQLRHILKHHQENISLKKKIIIKRVPYTFLRLIFSKNRKQQKYNRSFKFFDLFLFLIEYGALKLLAFYHKLKNNAYYWGLYQDNLGWKMLRALNKENCDLIHTTCVPRSCVVASLLSAKKKNIPIMISPFYHYMDKTFYMHDKFWMKILNDFDFINVCTDAEREYLIKHGVNEKKIGKIGLGVYYKSIYKEKKINWKNRLNIPTDKFTVLYMSTQIYNPGKGILQVIGAAQELPEIDFIFTGQDKNSWNHMLSRHFPNIKLYNVHYLGYISEEEKDSLLKEVDLLVRPSIFESFGIFYFEGLRYGKPIITSNIDSMKEISKDVGLAVEHGNVEELVKAIKKLQLDTQLYQKFSQNAIKKSEAYSWKKISKKFNQIYESLGKSENKN